MRNYKKALIIFCLIGIECVAQHPQRKLMESIMSGNQEAVEYWLGNGADINKKYSGELSINGVEFPTSKANEIPLHAAILSMNTDMFLFLLDKGADPDAENGFGASPIQVLVTKSNFCYAVPECGFEANRDIKMAQALVNKKADLNGKAFGKRTLTLAAEYSKYRPESVRTSLCNFLKANGAKE